MKLFLPGPKNAFPQVEIKFIQKLLLVIVTLKI